MRIRPLPHHFAGVWTKEDVSNLEDDLQVLFENLKRLATDVSNLPGSGSDSGSTLLVGPQGPPGLDGEDARDWFPTSGAFSSGGGTGTGGSGLTPAQILARVMLHN